MSCTHALRVLAFALLVCGLPEGARGGGADAWAASPAVRADTTLVFTEAPLREVLRRVERSTGVRFLYRDAIVAGVRVSLKATGDEVLANLRDVLEQQGLSLAVDRGRNQAILTRARDPSPEAPAVLRGQVVDDASGARLPLATLTWTEDGRRRGVATGEEGTFRIPIDGALARRTSLELTVSYVGYRRATVRVDPQDPPAALTVRLVPDEAQAPEVVVQSYALQTGLDTTGRSLIRPERSAALGEASVLRALQPLPAVSLTPALVEGLSVRGSRADGFGVLLDGIPIYNQNHLFGLFDAFNAEALQTVGFYYGVAPAAYEAPPGGTLAFRTRTGSQRRMHATAEASPTAVSGTVEGPLAGGQGSWLVSARHSILGVDWFGNDALIEQGLGVDRRTESPDQRGREASEVLLRPGSPSARFFDVHAKGLWETDHGGRWTLSTYVGGDAAEQPGRRVELDPSVSFRERLRRDVTDTTVVETDNRWGNVGASLQWRRPLGARALSTVSVAASRYYSRYATDDFLYVRPRTPDLSRYEFDALSQDNTLVEGTLTHRVALAPRHPGTWTLGYAASIYDVTYAETSALEADYQGEQTSVRADLFGQYDRRIGLLDLQVGLRTHYYSQGDYIRFSPRLEARFWPDRPVSLGVGYTRNHQFLHRLHLVGDVSSAVWVPSTEAQPPGGVDHLMGRIALRPASTTRVRLEGYWKTHEHLRRHATHARLSQDAPAVLFQPWTVDNTAVARGLEVLLRQKIGPVTWTGAYTWARVELDPEGSAAARPADWDRRHEVTTRAEWAPSTRTAVYATWTYATGPPNPYRAVPAEPDRLGAYHRLDLGASTVFATGALRWTLRGSLFNAYDRDNPWHRTAVGLFQPDGPDPNRRADLGVAFVDVYDLGLRPSVSVSAAW